MHFQVIRRAALRVPYRLDRQACDAARAAGWRVGWAPGVRALHLGFDDVREHPGYVRAKAHDPLYAPAARGIAAAPSLRALAGAAPVLAATRALGIADDEVDDRCGVLAAVPRGPLRRARAVVVGDPDEVRAEGEAVVLTASLEDVGGRLADELAPAGWRGEERPGVGDAAFALAEAADTSPVLRRTAQAGRPEDWLGLFAAAAFGPAQRRVFVFTPARTRQR